MKEIDKLAIAPPEKFEPNRTVFTAGIKIQQDSRLEGVARPRPHPLLQPLIFSRLTHTAIFKPRNCVMVLAINE
jgi:hypothetical protein